MTSAMLCVRLGKPLLVILGAGLLSLGAMPASARPSARDRAEARRHISLLHAKDAARLKAAYAALVAMGDRASYDLARALGNRDKQVRSYASAVLQKTGEAAIDDIVPMLGQRDPVHRSTAAYTLSKIGAAAVPALVTKLGDRSDTLREAAVQALVLIGDASASAVTEAAKGGDERVREAAARILAKLGKPMPPEAGPAKQPVAKGEPTPTPTPTPRPQPATRPKPRQPVAARPGQRAAGQRVNLRKEPPVPAIKGARSKVDDGRKAITLEIITEIEALVKEGKRAEARVLLWGVWAQSKRARSLARRRGASVRGLATIDAWYYQRAHDACFGSGPSLLTTDEDAELADAIESADRGLNMGDLGSAREVIDHVNARLQAGVRVRPKTAAAMRELVQRFNALHAKDGARLGPALSALLKGVMVVKDRDIEEAMHALQSALVDLDAGFSWERIDRARHLVLQVRESLPPARKGLEELSAMLADPLHFDQMMLGIIPKNPAWAGHYARLLHIAAAVVYAERQLKAWDLPERLGDIYLRKTDVFLSEAEKAYQYDKAPRAKGHLANAVALLAQAEALGMPAEGVAARRERLESIKASAGAGKLRRAGLLMKEAEAGLARATAGGAEKADERLTSAKGWIAAARKAGIPAAQVGEAEARLKALEGKLPALYAALATAELETGERLLGEARERLRDAERAFSASTPLDGALALHGRARAYIGHVKPPFDAAQASALQARATELARDAAALRTMVVATQRMPSDVYRGASGARWRASFRSLAEREYPAWEVLAISITDPDWKNTSATYEYAGGGNTRISETRWYRQLFAWVAVADPDNSGRVQLRYLGFRLHKFTDGSYRQLKLYWVENPVPMLRQNLPK